MGYLVGLLMLLVVVGLLIVLQLYEQKTWSRRAAWQHEAQRIAAPSKPVPAPPVPTLDRNKLPLGARLAALVDVETTGLSPESDGIVEFAGTLFAFEEATGQVLGQVYEYSSLNDPGIPISPGAARVNRLSDQMVRGHRLDNRRVDSLLSEAEFIIAHNAEFDRGFVSRVSPVAAIKPWRCSMAEIGWVGCSSVALQQLLRHHGITPSEAHRALDDVRCALQLLATQDSSGNPYLLQLFTGKKGERVERSLAGSFTLELSEDPRDKKLTEYQRKGVQILAQMEIERWASRRSGQLIEPRFYEFSADVGKRGVSFIFETPMEGVELMRRYAGRETQWFRLRDDEDPTRSPRFNGEPAKYRITEIKSR